MLRTCALFLSLLTYCLSDAEFATATPNTLFDNELKEQLALGVHAAPAITINGKLSLISVVHGRFTHVDGGWSFMQGISMLEGWIVASPSCRARVHFLEHCVQAFHR